MTKTTIFVLTPNELQRATTEFLQRLYPELGQQELKLEYRSDYQGKMYVQTEIKETK
jgi:hypothetical protein